MTTKRADTLRPGQWIKDGNRSLCIESIGGNSIGDVVLRCSYSGPGAYPGTSLLLRPDEPVAIAGR